MRQRVITAVVALIIFIPIIVAGAYLDRYCGICLRISGIIRSLDYA